MNIVTLGFIVWLFAFAIALTVKFLILSQIPEEYKGVELPNREDDPELKKVRSMFKGVELASAFVWIFGFITLLSITQYFFIQTGSVVSGSMKPTINTGDYFFVDRISFGFNKPGFDDVIFFKVPKKALIVEGYKGDFYEPPVDGFSRFLDDMSGRDNRPNYVKRIIGVPGDEILVSPMGLYRNGKLTKNHFKEKSDMIFPTKTDYLKGNMSIIYKNNYYFVKVPKDKYFVMGDNINKSLDSRDWGFVDRKEIKGKVVYIYFPLNRKGKVK